LRCAQGGIEILEAADSHALHPFQVGLDSFFGDIAVHPVPPDARFCAVRRIPETLLQGIARILRRNNPRT
jgi:hypothetical protein